MATPPCLADETPPKMGVCFAGLSVAILDYPRGIATPKQTSWNLCHLQNPRCFCHLKIPRGFSISLLHLLINDDNISAMLPRCFSTPNSPQEPSNSRLVDSRYSHIALNSCTWLITSFKSFKSYFSPELHFHCFIPFTKSFFVPSTTTERAHGAPGPVLVHFGTQKALLLGQQHLRLRQEVTRLHLALHQPGAEIETEKPRESTMISPGKMMELSSIIPQEFMECLWNHCWYGCLWNYSITILSFWNSYGMMWMEDLWSCYAEQQVMIWMLRYINVL